jgi:hypothetical protein
MEAGIAPAHSIEGIAGIRRHGYQRFARRHPRRRKPGTVLNFRRGLPEIR